MKKYSTLIIIGFALGVLIYIFLNFTGSQKNIELFLSGCLGSLTASLLQFFNDKLNHLISWKAHTGFRLLAGILSNTVLGSICICVALYACFHVQNHPDTFSNHFKETFLKLGILLFFIALIYNVIYFAIHSYNEYAKGQIAKLQLERKQTALQLAALKSQLSPHFLFNSMNTVSSLLYNDVKRAELFIRELAKSYLYTLNKYDDPLVKLKEELQFVNSYYFLLKTRFKERIDLNISIPPEILDSQIPPLTLQMLLENSVKHNQMSAAKTLEVNITCENQNIVVSNNKTIKPKQVDSFGIGLSNIKSRYKLLANRSIEVLDQSNFIVKLPVVYE